MMQALHTRLMSLKYSFEYQINLCMQAHTYLCLLVVSKRDALFLRYAENIFVVNGWQLAKMKMSIPDMSLP